MKLIQFVVKKMHGYIDVNIRFKDDISILIGGNGSGKTSALALLANVLRVESDEILKTTFDELELIYEIAERRSRTSTFKLVINKPDKLFVMSLYRGSDLVAQQNLHSKSQTVWGFDLDDLDLERSLTSASWAKALSKFKKDSPKSVASTVEIDAKITFVRLDRAISAIDSHGGMSFEDPDSKKDMVLRNAKKGRLRDPLEVVREVTSSKYVFYRNRLEEIKAKTYDQLFRIHFSDSDISLDATTRLDRLEKKLGELEQRLMASASIIPSEQNFEEFQNYLRDTKLISEEVQATKAARKSGRRTRLEEVLSAQLASRSRKIELLLKVFDEESNDSASAYQPLSVYLSTLNRFLRDSGKELVFSQSDNNLYHYRIRSGWNNITQYQELGHLSSGEKQIVIVLTYLAFLAEPGSIFIVDEPELSLHLKWQRMLVDALKALCPQGCQIVMATHAPEIAGRARDKCMRLNDADAA